MNDIVDSAPVADTGTIPTPAVETVRREYYFRTKGDYKRPTVVVLFPAPTNHGVVELLNSEDDKVIDLITETMQNVLANHVKGYIDEDMEFDQAKLDKLINEGKISFEAIAHTPSAQRNTLNKEMLEQFVEAYIALMPNVTGRSLERVQAAGSLYLSRFKAVAGDSEILGIIQEQLGVFINNASPTVLTENDKVIQWAISTLDTLLKQEITADSL